MLVSSFPGEDATDLLENGAFGLIGGLLGCCVRTGVCEQIVAHRGRQHETGDHEGGDRQGVASG